MADEKLNHGGDRPGSGRKPEHPEGRGELVCASIPLPLLDKLDEIAKPKGWKRSRAIVEAVRDWVKT